MTATLEDRGMVRVEMELGQSLPFQGTKYLDLIVDDRDNVRCDKGELSGPDAVARALLCPFIAPLKNGPAKALAARLFPFGRFDHMLERPKSGLRGVLRFCRLRSLLPRGEYRMTSPLKRLGLWLGAVGVAISLLLLAGFLVWAGVNWITPLD